LQVLQNPGQDIFVSSMEIFAAKQVRCLPYVPLGYFTERILVGSSSFRLFDPWRWHG